MFEKLSSNLDALMLEIRISAEELARRTNIPASTIKKIRNQDNSNPTLATLLPLAEFFCLTLGQLAGDEPMPQQRTKGAYRVTPTIFRQVPILSWQDAVQASAKMNAATQYVTSEHLSHENAFALILEEDNWENLPSGTTLIIDPQLKPEHRDFVLVNKKNQNTPTVKQILLDDGNFYLKPLVQGYQITMMTEEHELLGVIVEYKKLLKNTLLEIA